MSKESRDVFVALHSDGSYIAAVNERPERSVLDYTYVPATLSYELPKPEPKFKVGDVIRQYDDERMTVTSVDENRYGWKTMQGTGWGGRLYVESHFELVPVPSFVVGEMVLDTRTKRYARACLISGPGDVVVIEYGNGDAISRYAHELEKVA